MRAVCINCRERPKRNGHPNTKYCNPCKKILIKRPKSTLSREQKKKVLKLIRKMPTPEIAERLGTSVSNIKRAFRGRRLAFHNKYAANPELVKKVIRYYEKHGLTKTQKQFPNIRVRSVVERYEHKPRQVRWTSDQILECVKMAGLVSYQSQARFFSRPGAGVGSLAKFWQGKMMLGPNQLHGLFFETAQYLVLPRCPTIQVVRSDGFVRHLYLWSDIETHLNPLVAPWAQNAVHALAKFQKTLFRSNRPRTAIQHMIKKREIVEPKPKGGRPWQRE